MKALIIEDNRDFAELFAMLLTQWGHEVHTVCEAEAALDTARKVRPEIIFVDVGIPRMDGYLLARRLRDERCIDGVKIVAQSCYLADQIRLKQSGIDSYLLKPVALKTLLEVIGR
jgi:DNA-binding response OmpR family regulator